MQANREKGRALARALIRIGALVPITLRRAWRLRAVTPSSLQSRQMRLMPDGSPSWREPHKPPPYGDCRQSIGRQVNARIHRQAPAGQWRVKPAPLIGQIAQSAAQGGVRRTLRVMPDHLAIRPLLSGTPQLRCKQSPGLFALRLPFRRPEQGLQRRDSRASRCRHGLSNPWRPHGSTVPFS